VDSRSSSSLPIAAALAALLAGCLHPEKPAERATLAEPAMRFDDDPRGDAAERRLDARREGSVGQAEEGEVECR
jgi:hypothetical protein